MAAGIDLRNPVSVLAIGIGLMASGTRAEPLPKHEVRVHGGRLSFDLTGVGTTGFVGMDYSRRLGGGFAFSAGATYAKTFQQYGIGIPYLIPEAGFTYGKRFGFAEPYVGAGAGLIVDLRTDVPDSASYVVNSGSGLDVSTVGLERSPLEPVFSAESGVKLMLPGGTGAIVLSVKIRGHGADFSGMSSETGLGVSSAF